MSKYVTQNYRNFKMYTQNNRLSDTPKALLSLLLIIVTSCFGLFNKYIHRYRTAFSFFCRKRKDLLKIMKKKTLPFRPIRIYIPITVTEDAREQFLQETFVLLF